MKPEPADLVYLRVWNGATFERAAAVVGSTSRRVESRSTAFCGKTSISMGMRCICDGCRAKRGRLPVGKRQAVFGR